MSLSPFLNAAMAFLEQRIVLESTVECHELISCRCLCVPLGNPFWNFIIIPVHLTLNVAMPEPL